MVWNLTVLGLSTVFTVLGVLYLFFVLIGVLFSRKEVVAPTPELVSERVEPRIASPVVVPSEDTETVAVIGAVIAAMTQGRGKIVRMKRLGKKTGRSSRWKYHEPVVEWRLKKEEVRK